MINQNSYRFGLYHAIGEPGSTAGLAYDLFRFIQERPQLGGEFTSYIASFVEPKLRTAEGVRRAALEAACRICTSLDREFFKWNPEVSSEPSDPEFSFSFAENAFFVVGLSPASQRWARRFPWPTLVFNDHSQFEKLREEQRFDRIRDLIRDRDEAVHGSKNAMLSDYGGAHSEARQYAGRRVSEKWRCPVHFDIGGRTIADAARSASLHRPALLSCSIRARSSGSSRPRRSRSSDLMAFGPTGTNGSAPAARIDYNSTIYLTTGHVLYSNRSSKMLTIIRDDVGRHDFLFAPCSPEMFQALYGFGA